MADYQGPDRRHHEKTNSGTHAFGRRLIDRIARPHSLMPNWMMGLLLLVALGVAVWAFG